MRFARADPRVSLFMNTKDRLALVPGGLYNNEFCQMCLSYKYLLFVLNVHACRQFAAVCIDSSAVKGVDGI